MKHDSGVTEQHIQALLMSYLLNIKKHIVVIPNAGSILPHEADMVSYTRAGLLHEFEIKLDIQDFKKDMGKHKHTAMLTAKENYASYFWFVTFNFHIPAPAHVGWLNIDAKGNFKVEKEAPQLNKWKMGEDKYRYASQTLANRVSRMYLAYYFKQKP